MSSDKCGSQTIGCTVDQCRYNLNNCLCELSRIEVKPCCQRADDPDDSFCASFKAKS